MQPWQHAVLQLWFGGSDAAALSSPRNAWFRKDEAFDAQILERFLDLWHSARRGEKLVEVEDAQGALALLLLLDQFPRNLFRGSAEAFATDAAAQALAKTVVERGWDQLLPPVARWFVYLPLEHSENLADQHQSLRCFHSLPDSPGRAGVIDYARRHYEIVARFGRFPHRNAALGRASTEEEIAFLQQPGSSF
jgi:uncharacterized protein (DUF924 family)